MTNLKQYIPLKHKVTIYIPGTNGVSTLADNGEHVKSAAALLSRLYGGATATENLGFWTSPSEGLVTEKITTVYSYASALDDNGELTQVLQFCESLKKALAQEAISLEVDNELYFI